MLVTLVEAGNELLNCAKNGQWPEFLDIAEGMREMCFSIEHYAKGKTEKYYDTLWKTVENSRVSLERIMEHSKTDRDFVLQKTEFELIPLLRIAHIQFYYNAVVSQDEERKEAWMNGEGLEICKNQYMEEAERTGHYKYDLSIFILAYNKLEYTKLCVESVLRNLPKDATYELILCNHGSDDGTKEFFESIHPDKQLDLKNNGGGLASNYFILEGKYHIDVSNDVIITPNTFDILYHALEDDEKIGMALPMTSNISNLQVPQVNGFEIKYEGFNQLYQITAQHNQANKYLEEVRFRLCTPLYILRNALLPTITMYWCMLSMDLMFPDDMLSMLIRREGYKNVLMKDIYCHHFGSLTIREAKASDVDYSQGRRQYLERFGIDPWGKGTYWDYGLFKKLVCDKKDARRVLGIHCGMGSNPLKIQQELKERVHNENVELITFTDRDRYVNELAGISQAVYRQESWEEIFADMEGVYDYIIVEDAAAFEKNARDTSKKLYDFVAPGGKLILYLFKRQKKIQWYLKDTYGQNVTVAETHNNMTEIDDEFPQEEGIYLIIDKK
jgi:glycosyltransferase involved in cell wall biosynthesis